MTGIISSEVYWFVGCLFVDVMGLDFNVIASY